MLVLIILFILSIFFPFFWIVFLGYLGWLIFSAKKRRASVLEYEISKLILSNQKNKVIPVYYEAAQSYALDHGAELAYKTQKTDTQNDNLVFCITAHNKNYSVGISKWPDGNTFLSVEDRDDTNNDVNQYLKKTGLRKEDILASKLTVDDKAIEIDHAFKSNQEEENNSVDKLVPQDLTSIIPRNHFSDKGYFFDMFKDLEGFFLKNSDMSNTIMMPVLYALRLSYAGMYAQGMCTKLEFDQVDQGFFNRAIIIGANISKEEQIEFQENSLTSALEWISHFYKEIPRYASSLLVSAAKADLSLQEMINIAIEENEQDIEFIESLNLDLLDDEFCLMFFKMGGWLQDQGKEDFKEKSFNFLIEPLLQPYKFLLKQPELD